MLSSNGAGIYNDKSEVLASWGSSDFPSTSSLVPTTDITDTTLFIHSLYGAISTIGSLDAELGREDLALVSSDSSTDILETTLSIQSSYEDMDEALSRGMTSVVDSKALCFTCTSPKLLKRDINYLVPFQSIQ